MQNNTRVLFNAYIQRLAQLNGVGIDAVTSNFVATPSVQQTLETKIQESSAFLKSVNVYPVAQQEGERIGMGVTGPLASRTDTTLNDRVPRDIKALDDRRYRCEQTNYDTSIRYAVLDMWAKFPQFQQLLTNLIIQRIALDRIMIGWHGTTVATATNLTTNPLLQDVNIGWLQKIRANAPERWMKEGVDASGKVVIGGVGADYKNLDALVFDVTNNMIDPWYQEDTSLVVICGRKLLSDKYFPLINKEDNPATEQLASDVIMSQKRIGNLPAVRVPHFPANALQVTRLDNLSIYVQDGTQRRAVIDNPKRDCVDTFQSSNDAYEIEDYGCSAFVENIEFAAA